MKNSSRWGWIIIIIVMVACERPQAPDFKLDHKLQAPLTIDKIYPFLGNSNALIDTTSDDYNSLFLVDSDGLVRLSKEEELNMGNLNDAIPNIEVDPTSINLEVGEIKLTNFNSAGSDEVGSASFETITGFSITDYGEGDTLPGGNSGTVNIGFNTKFFDSAEIKEGDLLIMFSNKLGFNIGELELTLYSKNLNGQKIQVSQELFTEISHDTEIQWRIDDIDGKILRGLSIDFEADWYQQPLRSNPEKLVINEVKGEKLVASEITAAIESHSFNSSGSSIVDDTNFKFRSSDHFIELQSGELSIVIDNNIDIAIDDLQITFPEIQFSGQPLVVKIKDIPARENGGDYFKTIDLAEYEIYAQCNCINYKVSAITKNMQDKKNWQYETKPGKATIHEHDALKAEIQLNDLSIKSAKGFIEPLDILLNEDIISNGSGVDVFHDGEAEITSVDGISSISDQISDITFANPLLDMIYETNLGVNTTIYASIVGVNKSGESIFLHSTDPDNEYFVPKNKIPFQLKNNGQPLKEGQVIKFPLATPTDGTEVIRFDAERTNISEFFSNLPSNIRFVGLARINEEQSEGTITNPVLFEPLLGVDIPVNFSANSASFKDTLDADLKDLPGEGDKRQLSEAILTIGYENGLPLDLQLSMNLLDQHYKTITVIGDSNSLLVKGASIDAESRFVKGQTSRKKLQVRLNQEQLKELNKTRFIELDIQIDTPEQQVVKVRAKDAVSFTLKMSVNVTSTVN